MGTKKKLELLRDSLKPVKMKSFWISEMKTTSTNEDNTGGEYRNGSTDPIPEDDRSFYPVLTEYDEKKKLRRGEKEKKKVPRLTGKAYGTNQPIFSHKMRYTGVTHNSLV